MLELESLSEQVLGAAIEVHREMGPGFWKKSTKIVCARSFQYGVWHLPGKLECRCSTKADP